MREEHDPNMRIRRALPDDAFSIAAVLHRSFVEYESCYTPDAFAATVSAPGKIQDRMNEGPDDLCGTPLFTMVKTLQGASERKQAELENATPGDNH